MFSEPPPLPEHELGVNLDKAYSDIMSKCRVMTRMERWSIRLALEANDIHSAQKALQRMDNITFSFLNDYGFYSGLVWVAIEAMRANALSQIIASGLADEKWLREQTELMLEKERHIPLIHKHMIMGDASCMIETMDNMESYARGLFLFCPDLFTFVGREGAELARCYLLNDFSNLPQKPNGISARMLANGLRLVGTKRMPSTLAAFRISRGMITAELARREIGFWPDAMNDLPTDPFSGKPLKYAVGKYEMPEELFLPNEDQEPCEITPVLQKQLRMTDEQAAAFTRPCKYTFRTERRTVDAVHIWSVGPNGIDDSSLKSTAKENNFVDRRTDDILFIIPIKK